MAEEKYYVLTTQSGYDLRLHDFEIAPNGTYQFTHEEALRKLTSMNSSFMPVAVPVAFVDRIRRIEQQPQKSSVSFQPQINESLTGR